jgi:putative transposase
MTIDFMSHPRPVRRSTRLRDFDYAQAGAYFVTITARNWTGAFSAVRCKTAKLTRAGEMVSAIWLSLPARFPGVTIDEFIAMPDHLHGIVLLSGAAGAMNRAPTLGEVVRVLKAASARQLRISGFPDFAWQRNFYEHVVRNGADLDRVRQYIRANPAAFERQGEEPMSDHRSP